MDRKLLIIFILIFGSVLASFQFRYEVINAGQAVAAYRLDRWTGEIILLHGTKAIPLEME